MKKPKVIVAIGGGDPKAIDREIVKMTGKKSPNALFIPTASRDDFVYMAWFHKRYGDELNCKTDVLCLLTDRINIADIRRRIEEADLIYVGGGNTLKMMRRWRYLGVDKMLLAAYKKGTVMCGLSAGANCWFATSHSDSMRDYNPDDWDYIKVKGLGIIDAFACPHYNAEKREDDFHAMLKKQSKIGLAIDNDAALCFIDDQYKVLSTRKGTAYKIVKRRGKLDILKLPKSPSLKPIKELLNK